MAWLENKAKQLPTGTKLDRERCQQLGLPKLAVQNAQSLSIKFLSGRILDARTGHVACKLKLKAQVLMMFDLRYFPWDEQSLFVAPRAFMASYSGRGCFWRAEILMLASQEDAHRLLVLCVGEVSLKWSSIELLLRLGSWFSGHIVLKNLISDDAVKAGEWAEVATFAKGYTTGGNSKAVFGLLIKRLAPRCSLHFKHFKAIFRALSSTFAAFWHGFAGFPKLWRVAGTPATTSRAFAPCGLADRMESSIAFSH